MTITTDDPFTPGQLASLRFASQGAVSVPGEDPYQEEVATWNLAVRLRPALVVGARPPMTWWPPCGGLPASVWPSG